MLKDTVVALDALGTLVHKHSIDSEADAWPGLPKHQRDGMGTFHAILRPSALAFVEALRKLEIPTVVVTGGSSREMRLLLGFAGLRRAEVYTLHELDELEQRARWVLVDDLPASQSTTIAKLEGIGKQKFARHDTQQWLDFVAAHMVLCAQFGGRSDPFPLTDLLPEVLRKLGLETQPAT